MRRAEIHKIYYHRGIDVVKEIMQVADTAGDGSRDWELEMSDFRLKEGRQGNRDG
jgi:hypothetical protein